MKCDMKENFISDRDQEWSTRTISMNRSRLQGVQRVLALPCDKGEAGTSSTRSEEQNSISFNSLVFQKKRSSLINIYLPIFYISNAVPAFFPLKAKVLGEVHSCL